MNQKITNLLKSTRMFVHKHSPEMLTGIGVAGMITSTVLAVKATPKALHLIEYAKKELHTDELTVIETVKAAWKPYIPSAVIGLMSVSCIIGGCAVNTKRNAALATAYSISEKALLTYRDKVVETVGERKEKDIRNKIAQDNVDKNQPASSQVIITSKGNTLCQDSISGRYFRSDISAIKKAVNELNKNMLSYNYVSLDEYYSKLGLNSIKCSDRLGWNIDDGFIELDFSSTITEDEEACIVVDHLRLPKYDFDMMR